MTIKGLRAESFWSWFNGKDAFLGMLSICLISFLILCSLYFLVRKCLLRFKALLRMFFVKADLSKANARVYGMTILQCLMCATVHLETDMFC